MAVFDELNALNINGHTETKSVSGKDLTYLSWPWAWAEVKKRYPDAHYSVWRDANGLPYTEDPKTGYMVFTEVTIDGVTHMMWLPVMDGANKAMRSEPYQYTTKFGTKTVDAATMMDINKTVMRCLVKNLAMFGLGLYIYAGEDLPEAEAEEKREREMPSFTPPTVKQPEAVAKVTAIPAVTKEAPKKETPAVNPVTQFLLHEMGMLREMRKISAAENNKLFKQQHEALIAAKLAPAKKLDEYTMDEAEALIDAMYKCFTITGTELKTE